MGGGRGGGPAAGSPAPAPSSAGTAAAARGAALPGAPAAVHQGGRRGGSAPPLSAGLLFPQDLCMRTGLRRAACLAATDALFTAAADEASLWTPGGAVRPWRQHCQRRAPTRSRG